MTILKYKVNQGINKTNGWRVERRNNLKILTFSQVFKLEFAINFAICNQTKSKWEGLYSSCSRNEWNTFRKQYRLQRKKKKVNRTSENLPEVAMLVQIHVWDLLLDTSFLNPQHSLGFHLLTILCFTHILCVQGSRKKIKVFIKLRRSVETGSRDTVSIMDEILQEKVS